MANDNLGNARKSKNDEFYTVYDYIQKEMNAYLEYNPDVFRDKVVLLPCDDPEWSNFTKYFAQNFETLGLKKLISTSYAMDCKKKQYEKYHQISLFELNSDLYDAEITDAKECGQSNCPLCALGTDNNSKRIWKINEMDADHVTAWSRGGSTDICNCQMLCKTHNRAKGNK